MDIKVSIIIPVYNMEDYIGECLDSVVNQTLRDIEIICVDDGSTDNTKSIISRYVDKEDNIILLCQEHQYASVALDYGLSKAKGDYIAFLDADDCLAENDSLEALYNKATEKKVNICFGELHNYLPDGSPARRYKDCIIDKDGYVDVAFPTPVSSLPRGWVNAIYKNSFLKENGISFGKYKIDYDVRFLFHVFIAAKGYYETKKNYYYRRVLEKAYNEEEDYEASFNCYYNLLEEYFNDRNKHPIYFIHFLIKLSQHLDYAYLIRNREINKKLSILSAMFEKDPGLIEKVERDYDVSLKIITSESEKDDRISKVRDTYNKNLNLIRDNKIVYIYGAGLAGRTLAIYLKKKEKIRIKSFIVSGKGGYKDSLTDIPVVGVSELSLNKDALILVATLYSKVTNEIISKLDELNIKNRIVIPYNELITYPFL